MGVQDSIIFIRALQLHSNGRLDKLPAQQPLWSLLPTLQLVLPRVKINAPSIYIFGGGTANKVRFNDTLCLSLSHHTLGKLETTGDQPSPRTYHASTLVDKFMAVIGGEARAD